VSLHQSKPIWWDPCPCRPDLCAIMITTCINSIAKRKRKRKNICNMLSLASLHQPSDVHGELSSTLGRVWCRKLVIHCNGQLLYFQEVVNVLHHLLCNWRAHRNNLYRREALASVFVRNGRSCNYVDPKVCKSTFGELNRIIIGSIRVSDESAVPVKQTNITNQ